MKIYITGDRGFIATHLRNELQNRGHEVVGADIKDIYNTDFRIENIALRAFKISQPDLVIHNAAQVGRAFGEDDTQYTIDSNAVMTTHVARACANLGIRLCYLSTSEVYGDQGDVMCYEGGPMAIPHNLYGLSKRWGEEACALYSPKLQIIRLSMPFGPGLPAGRGRAAIVNFIYNAMHNIPITVHKDSERSWCWVGDTVRGISMVLEQGMIGTTMKDYINGIGTYNVGRTDNPTSMLDVANIACELTGATSDLIHLISAPANQTRVKRLSNSKLIELGWNPTVSLREGMAMMLDPISKYA